MRYNGEKRLRAALKKARFEVKICREALRAERNKGYAEGYNTARREVANKLREFAGLELL